MPVCYLLAVAQGSALDRDTSNWSLFGLTEQIQILATAPLITTAEASLPFEVHCYWQLAPGEVNRDFEWRLLAVAGSEIRASQEFPLRSDKPRMRIRLKGLPLLLEGETTLQVEWRESGSQAWERCPSFWPFTVERASGTASPSSAGQSDPE